MKLTISTEGARLSIRLPDNDCKKLFNSLVSNVLNFEPVVQEIKRAVQCDDIHEEIIPCEAQPPKVVSATTREGYTGFLYIRCPECGEERGFCAKKPTVSHSCKKCGNAVELRNLHTVRFTCKCGKGFKYLTNIENTEFDVSCLECGAPNSVFRNPKTGDYFDDREAKT